MTAAAADYVPMTKINIGCGEFPAAGWTNIDVHPGLNPDVVASLLALPLPDASVDRAYLGHVLEHLSRDDVVAGLRELRRVVRPTGMIVVVAPDLTRAEAHFPDVVPDIVHGGGRWPGDAHLWDSRADAYPPMFEAAGWRAYEVPIGAVNTYWPVVSRIGWQAAWEATPA